MSLSSSSHSRVTGVLGLSFTVVPRKSWMLPDPEGTRPYRSSATMSRSVPPPGQGGGIDEPTNHWRASQLIGSRLPARAYAPGSKDIIIQCCTNDWSEDRPQTTRTQPDAKRTYESKAIKSNLDAHSCASNGMNEMSRTLPMRKPEHIGSVDPSG